MSVCVFVQFDNVKRNVAEQINVRGINPVEQTEQKPDACLMKTLELSGRLGNSTGTTGCLENA